MNLSEVSKAVAGGIVAVLVVYLAKHGITFDPLLNDAVSTVVTAIVTGLVGYVTVYFAPANKPK